MEVVFFLTLLLIDGGLSTTPYGEIPSQFISSSKQTDTWLFLRFNEIEKIIWTMYSQDSKIDSIVRGVQPYINKADDPLNKYIDVSTVLSEMKPILTRILKEELHTNDTHSDPEEILSWMYRDFHLPLTLNEAFRGRMTELSHIQKEREHDEVQLIKKNMTTVLENIMLESIDTVDVVNVVLTELIEISPNLEIKRVLSYPAVRELLQIELQRDGKNKIAMINSIFLALESFLLEAIHISDMAVVNELSNKVAKDMLVQRLSNYLGTCIKRGISVAKRVDAIFRDEYKNRVLAEKLEAFHVQLYNRGISMKLLKKPMLLLEATLNPDIFIDKKYLNFYYKTLGMLYDEVCTFFNDVEKQILQKCLPEFAFIKIIFDDHIKNDFLLYDREALYSTYVETHIMFSNDMKTGLSKFVNELITSKYKELNHSHVSYIDGGKILEQDVENPIENEKFLIDLEKEVTAKYGFGPGMFEYSISYHHVMQEVFPSFDNPFEGIDVTKASENEKEEL